VAIYTYLFSIEYTYMYRALLWFFRRYRNMRLNGLGLGLFKMSKWSKSAVIEAIYTNLKAYTDAWGTFKPV